MTATMVKGDIKLLDMIEMSEPGNAERLAIIARGRIHYVDTLGVWMAYRDGKWEMDGNGVSLQAFAKTVPQSLFTMAEAIKPVVLDNEDDPAVKQYMLNISWARKSNTEPSLNRMVKLARDLPGIRISHNDLDAKPWLFNCQNGTYDFMTNEFRDHDPGDLLTKQANVMYDPEAKCPAWLGYLNEWQPDKAIQQFLAEITGSGLTGVAVQNLFVNVGEGRNGKGTFYKQIQIIIGDYAGTAPEDMLIESRFRVHDEEKARLRGCRFLIAPETGAGDRLDEAGIRNLTGGDMLHGRHLYGRPFDFKPTHTAFVHTNYEPIIKGTDAAIWNRVIKIPWNVFIPAERRDMLIDDKLEAERPGILNWLIAGCQQFKKHGIKPPASIMESTEGYRKDQDIIGRFITDCFHAMVTEASSVIGPVDYIQAAILRSHYEAWCRDEGVKPWIATNVGRELRHKGWETKVKRIGEKTPNVWYYPSATTSPEEPPGTGSSVSSVVPVVPLCILKVIRENEEEESNKEVNIESGTTQHNTTTLEPSEPTEEEREQTHREWLYDHGYPVPPTDEEIEAMQRSMYDDMRDRETPPEPPE